MKYAITLFVFLSIVGKINSAPVIWSDSYSVFPADTLSLQSLSSLKNEFNRLCNEKNYAEAKKLIGPLNELIVRYGGERSVDYELFLRNVIDAYVFTFEYDKALEYCHKYQRWVETVEKSGTIYDALSRWAYANVLFKKGNVDDAQKKLVGCMDLLEILPDSAERANLLASCHNLNGLIMSDGAPLTAIKEFSKTLEIYSAANMPEVYKVTAISNCGYCYANMADYEKAAECFAKAIRILESCGQNSSIETFSLMNNMALCKIYLGQLSDGMMVLDTISDSVRQNYGENNELYASVLQNMCIYYARVFEYDKMLDTAAKTVGIWQNISGTMSFRYGSSLQNLGYAFLVNGQYADAENALNESIYVLRQICGEDHLIMSSVYHNLALAYFYEKKYEECDAAFSKCNNILQLNEKTKTIDYVGLLVDYGRFLLLLNSDNAEVYLSKAKNICKEIGIEEHPIYLQLMAFCMSASILGQDTAEDLIEETVEALFNQYKNNISIFTSADRQAYWTRMNGLKSLLFSLRKTEAGDVALYDYLLLSKGMLLGTNIAINNFLSDVDDLAVKDDFKRLQSIRRMINNELIKKASDRKTYLDSLQKEAEVLERSLVFRSREFGDYTKAYRIKYEDVAANLDKKSVAIEYINYNDYSDDGSVVYAALVTRKGWKVPEFIRLFKESEIVDLIDREPSEIYSKDAYVSRELYNKVWAPLTEYIRKGDTVFFSPSGILYKLALESMCDNKGNYLNELYNLVRCSSTKYSCNMSDDILFSSAVLYGGLYYDMDLDRMVALSRGYRTDSFPERYAADVSVSKVRSGWEYLPGTKKEVEAICSLLDSCNVEYQLVEGEKGNEESFDALSRQSFDIVHIATHGFFVDKATVNKSDYYMNYTSLIESYGIAMDNAPISSISSVEIEAMLRSGLMLSGGNMAWKGYKIPDYIEDGVLTASEIAGMDLHNTDMVVLSACETALGEVSDDGVLGLQRAFKNAGVQTVVMSLWKVDDNATELMMEEFYRHLLRGETKRESFTKAQSAVRVKYNDPFYWAAFIMLD